MRLIDADKLKEVIHSSYSDDLEILEKIDQHPTAYDVNLVIEKLEEEKTIAYDDSIDEKIRVRLWNKAIGNAIKIVEGGIR